MFKPLAVKLGVIISSVTLAFPVCGKLKGLELVDAMFFQVGFLVLVAAVFCAGIHQTFKQLKGLNPPKKSVLDKYKHDYE